jgi:hypothetical protein
MKIITLVVSFALFAFCAPAPLGTSGLVVEKWKYDPQTKILSLKLVNTSGKVLPLTVCRSWTNSQTARRTRCRTAERLERAARKC